MAKDGVDAEGWFVGRQSVKTEPEAGYAICWVEVNLVYHSANFWPNALHFECRLLGSDLVA